MPSALPIHVRQNGSFMSHPQQGPSPSQSRQSYRSPGSLTNYLTMGGVSFESLNNLKMLGTSAENDRARSFQAFLAQENNPLARDDFCKDFTCCGLVLSDLHSLLQHYEECHVVVMESPGMTPQTKITGPTGTFEIDSMELDATPAGVHVRTMAPGHSAFDTSVMRTSRPNAAYPTAIQTSVSRTASPTRSGASTPMSQRYQYGVDSPSSPSSSITPALLSAPATPFSSRPSSPTAGTPDSTTTVSRPGSSLTRSKPFKCPTPGCNKQYLQANGLKYHRLHGQCNFASKDPSLEGLTEQEAEEKLRPYACAVGGNCDRRYKNMNGLRYHYQHSGAHGAIGLALLASGQHHALPGKAGQSHLKRKQEQEQEQRTVVAAAVGQQHYQHQQPQQQQYHVAAASYASSQYSSTQQMMYHPFHGYAAPMGDISMGD